MSETEKFMTLKEFQNFFKDKIFGKNKKVSETAELPVKPDVDKAIQQMVLKMKPYMDKINEPTEQVAFLTKLFDMMHFDKSRLPMLIAQLKQSSDKSFDTEKQVEPVQESRILTKNQFIESIKPNVIRILKVKDIK